MKTVTIAGAGFSGLTLALELRRRGIGVRVVESSPQAGGLISTRATPFGAVESAANAILLNENVARLFEELKIPLAPVLKSARRKLIYWGRPSRWPVSGLTSLRLARLMFSVHLRSKRIQPAANESVRDWACRVVDSGFEERLLSPALQGVYAAGAGRLSAKLVLRNFLSGRRQGRSAAPAQGMGQLIDALVQRLKQDGVSFEFGRTFELREPPSEPTVIATSAWAAGEILASALPSVSSQIQKCEALPLVSATAFFETHGDDVRGFGCLFPRSQGFHSLGVLFNSDVFRARSPHRSETWIFGGDFALQSDSGIEAALLEDRRRLTGRSQPPLGVEFKKYPRALPHYTVEWAQTLANLKIPAPLYLHGNYLGQLGLSGIYDRSIRLAEEIKKHYG